MLGVAIAINAIQAVQAEKEAFEEHCKNLPEEEANKLKIARGLRIKSNREHQRALELANASRPRNFWGN